MSATLFEMTPPPQLPGNGRFGPPSQSGQSPRSAWLNQPVEPDQLSNGHIVSNQALLRPPSPRGHPILDPNENNQLGTFFNGLESDLYEPHFLDNELQFSEHWLSHGRQNIVPSFLAHLTSFGRQVAPDLTLGAVTAWPAAPLGDVYTFGQNDMAPPSVPLFAHTQPPQSSPPQPRLQSQTPPFYYHPPLPQQPFHGNGNGSFHAQAEQDAHENAAALLTRMHSGRPNPSSPLTSSSNGLHPSLPMVSQRHDSSSLTPSYVAQNHHDPAEIMIPGSDGMLFANMVLGTYRPPVQHTQKPQELQWGSDNLFSEVQGFLPPHHESSEAVADREQLRIERMREALRSNSSSPNTQVPSPIVTQQAAIHTTTESHNDNIKDEVEENAATDTRKRRKSKARIEGEEDGGWGAQLPSKPAARKRKSKSDQNGSVEPSAVMQDTLGKRRKCAPNQSKPQRENLTEEQKRENHIRSEQKRRGTIKEGFDDLAFIVPGLQNGGYSKSIILNMTGDWLEKLVQGNETLEPKSQLAP